ncbi:hypothetical protein M0804_006216 [Polistes exclamans]|nr:hypothetical protein M0804_006216 [Polistes exclamans]
MSLQFFTNHIKCEVTYKSIENHYESNHNSKLNLGQLFIVCIHISFQSPCHNHSPIVNSYSHSSLFRCCSSCHRHCHRHGVGIGVGIGGFITTITSHYDDEDDVDDEDEDEEENDEQEMGIKVLA